MDPWMHDNTLHEARVDKNTVLVFGGEKLYFSISSFPNHTYVDSQNLAIH